MATSSPPRIAELPLFDGFPYLVVQLAPGICHITLLPEDASEPTLVGIARAQRRANLLDVCLVMGPAQAFYIYNRSGLENWTATPPRGGYLVTGQLRPPTTWPDTPHFRARRGRLNVRLTRYGSAFGDLTKGGRAASADEVMRLGRRTRRRAPRPRVLPDVRRVARDVPRSLGALLRPGDDGALPLRQ
jgi:hypothetical protein